MSLEIFSCDNVSVSNEIITDPSKSRFCAFPIIYVKIWDLYKKQQSSFWRVEEIDLSQDYNHWIKLSDDEQYVIKMTLAFFANTDGIVNLNISSRLMNEITINEAQVAYTFQMMMENIHSEMYALLLDNIIKNHDEKKYLFDAIHTIPSIKKISDWALKWIDSDTHLGNRIVAFACVEGIFFSGAFATIFWLKKYKSNGELFMPGLTKSNEFISRDEGMHTEFACELFNMLVNKPNINDIYNIVTDSVNIAQNFVNESIKCKLVGLNNELMNQYIEYVADGLLISLGYEKIYKSTNPFTFMNSIGMMQKTNFHESRPTEYQSAYTTSNDNKELEMLSLDDF